VVPGFRIDVSACPSSVQQIRRSISTWADFLSDDARTDLVLAVSEIVTNSVRHGPARGRISIDARRSDDGIRVDVRDDGEPQRLAPREPDDEGGRGLHIVAAIADTWGVSADPTCVWFTMRTDG
jgi:anti-sigma regulatory factor (Ser/Thr protein kinase)